MSARNADLEAQIAKTPDDPGPYLVYADWLSEQNDPRGELITIGVSLEKTPGDAKLVERDQALHTAHDAEWLGGLAEFKDGVDTTWRYGFLHSLTLGGSPKKGWGAVDIDLAEAYASARPLPVAAFLRELSFGGFEDDGGEPSWDDAADALVEHGAAPTLRRLEFSRGSYWDISWTNLDKLEPVYAKVPQLESLRIEMGHFSLGNIDLPNLREFEVYTGGFTPENVQEVVRAKWPKLERLILRFGNSEDYGGTCTLDDALPILEAKNLPNVKHLAIANAGFVNDFVKPLAESELLKRLESLDLSMGTLGDEGAQVIVDHADAFRHLRSLDVSQSYLSEGMIDQLRGIVKVVQADNQDVADDEDPENRYCQIGE